MSPTAPPASSPKKDDMHDLLIKLSPENSSTLDELLTSMSDDKNDSPHPTLSANNKNHHPSKIFTILTPLLFKADNVDTCTIAQSILTTMIRKRPSLLHLASTSINTYIQHDLQPSDEFIVTNNLLQLILQQIGGGTTTTSLASDASDALQTLCQLRPPLVNTLLKIMIPIPHNSTIMIRYYTLILHIMTQEHVVSQITSSNTTSNTTNMDMNLGMNVDENVYDHDTNNQSGSGAFYNSNIDSVNLEQLWKPFLDGLSNDRDPLLQMSLLEVLEATTTTITPSSSSLTSTSSPIRLKYGHNHHTANSLLQNWVQLDPILLKMVGIQNEGTNTTTTTTTTTTTATTAYQNHHKNELHPFCAGAALRLLAKIYSNNPTMPSSSSLSSYPSLELDPMATQKFLYILDSFQSKMSGENDKIAFIDGITTFCCCDCRTISSLSSSTTTRHGFLYSLLQYVHPGVENQSQGRMEQEILENWLSLRLGNSKMKVIVLNSVSKTITAIASTTLLSPSTLLSNHRDNNDSSDPNHSERLKKKGKDTQKICMALYDSIGYVNDVGAQQSTTEYIMEKCLKTQLVEVRLGAYDLFTSLVNHTAKGGHILMRYGGFYDFLCNQSIETVQEGMALKYELVKAIVGSDVKGLLTVDIVQNLQRIVDDGPHYYAKNRRNIALE